MALGLLPVEGAPPDELPLTAPLLGTQPPCPSPCEWGLPPAACNSKPLRHCPVEPPELEVDVLEEVEEELDEEDEEDEELDVELGAAPFSAIQPPWPSPW